MSFTLVSCDDDMDIQQSYAFTVEVMPVPNKVVKGEYPFCQTDDITLKTIIRSNPGLLLAFRTWQVAMKSEADISRVAYLRSLYHW